MARAHPFFGVGHNGYRAAYNEFDNSRGQYGAGRSVHSMWFGVMSEQGFLGLLFFISIFLYSLRACMRVRRKCSNDPERKSLSSYAIAIETSLLTAAIGGTFLPFQYVEMLWHFFALAVVIEQIAFAPAVALEMQDISAQRLEEVPLPQNALSKT
jgi:O-antigen ligase